MSWSESTRRDRLPSDWTQRRRRILRRDGYMCQWELPDGSLCLDSAHEVDHKNPGDDHRDSNLQALCTMHHARKSAGEGGAAVNAKRRENANRFSITEAHPGLIP